MIIRGAMGRKLPYVQVNKSSIFYFIENKGDGFEIAEEDKVFYLANAKIVNRKDTSVIF